MDLVKAEEERLRRQKANEDLPPLPPLLAQILAETRAKQAAKKAAQEKGETTGEENAQAAGDEEAKPQTGPLLLEAPPSGLVMQGTNVAPQKEQRDSDDSDAEGEPDQPPGPLDASRCGVHGPGFSGAAAGQTVKLTITARDSAGKRIREGGAHILVMVEPPSAPGAEEEPDAIQADVVDHGNGTYTASYSVPTKGNYQLHIEVNGDPLGDSPYPLFFSAPVPQPEAAAGVDPQLPAVPGALQPGAAAAMPGMSMPMPALGAGGLPIVTAESIKAAQQQAAAGGAGGAAMTAAFPNLATGVQISLGTQLAQMGWKFPEMPEPGQGERMVVVGGLVPHATPEDIRSVFAICGTIRFCSLAGTNTGCAFVEFSAPEEAAKAVGMTGVSLLNQPLRVELAAEAKKAADAVAVNPVTNPYLALQAQQMQHFKMLQEQQRALAEQVLAMRAAARGKPAPAAAPNYHSNDSQKSAAIAAALALTKKLGAGGAAAAADGGERKRSRSRSRSRERRRSRSRDRKRSKSRERRRSRSRDKRRRGDSRERDRKRSHRSRSRSRDRHHKHSKHSKHSRRDRDDRKERRRSRSRSRDRKRNGKAEAVDVDAPLQLQGGLAAQTNGNDVAAAAAQQPPPAKDELEELLDELGD